MVLLGLVLLVAGVVFGLDLLWKDSFRIPTLHVFGQSLGLASSRWLFLVGVITGAAVVLGLVLLLGGTKRKATKSVSARRDRKEGRAARRERDELRAENADLRARQEQAAASGGTGTAEHSRVAGASRDDEPVEQ